jgi:CDP-6-deoxy-D-xylo-4-hexulose-3-dehydrase
VFAGNMLRQPAFTEVDLPIRIGRSAMLSTRSLSEADLAALPSSDVVMHRTFWVGVYPGMRPGMIDFIADEIRRAIDRDA